ncbi:MAG: hypothetical protein Q9162_006771 [Coniocarpon cinnabarinum]
MNYLKYIEHDAENLQFFLWARTYQEKFNRLPASEKRLSPEWSPALADDDANHGHPRSMKVSADTAAALKGTGLDSAPRVTEVSPSQSTEKVNPFYTPPRTPTGSEYHGAPSELSSNGMSGGWTSVTNSTEVHRKAEVAYDDAGLKWQPFTIQPFRDEIARVISIYIADGGPRQLNLSSKERNALLHALENTTHPSAFYAVLTTVEWSLRTQSHPNFVRWTICNGNRPRVVFARGLGVGGIVGGIIVGILLALSGAGRAWRIFPLILFFIGIATLVAAVKGMCVVLHGMHHRHLRPWELFADDDDRSVELKKDSFDTLDSQASSNSYEDEPWVAKYKRRNVIRKIFDRELWIQEPALRQIQDTIFLQAILSGLVGGAILTAVFIAVPNGGFY